MVLSYMESLIQKFDNYLKSGKVLNVGCDKLKARALWKLSKKRREKFNLDKNDKFPEFAIEQIHEIIRELIQSLMAIKGFKPYSHEAHIAFLIKYYTFSNQEINVLIELKNDRNNILYNGEISSLQKYRKYQSFLSEFSPRIEKLIHNELV